MPPDVTLAVSEAVWAELTGTLADENETAGVLLAGWSAEPERPALVVNSVKWVDEQHYVRREPLGLTIRSAGWTRALKEAADRGLHAIFFHSHPNGEPNPSRHDYGVDDALENSFRIRTRANAYASLILGGTTERPSFSGRVLHESGGEQPITRVRVVGTQIQIFVRGAQCGDTEDDLIHERQVRVFGEAGQRRLSRLRVGIVGAGGTGSAVSEQLIRLGVQNLVVVDDDLITATNVSRVYGSTVSDVGKSKVDVVTDNAQRIGLNTDVTAVFGRANSRATLEKLRGCDVIFGCTDDHLGRLNLSRLAYYYLIPIIDLGVVIDATVDRIRSVTGRITYVAPGQACLVCADVVDPDVAREEGYAPAERASLAAEGYARGLGEPDPSVVAYTTMVAACGVADLLERLFGFGEADPPSEIRLRIADRKVARRRPTPQPRHICAVPESWGLGDQAQFLGQRLWPA
jgi:proteasome lid subunit RPN8/RPN11